MNSVLLVYVLLAPSSAYESRTMAQILPKPTGTNLTISERLVLGRTFVLATHTINPDGSTSFSRATYRMDGVPVRIEQEGNWGGRMNRFVTDYGAKGATQSINEATNRTDQPDRTFRDPTKLWFWKVQPRVGESVVVTYLAQNVIATSRIRYTYEGDETMALAGRTARLHRVREDPQGTSPGVYTIRWFDDQGMDVKRYHKTTKAEYGEELAYWY